MNESVITNHSLAHIAFRADWQSGEGQHSEIFHVEKFNVWRDIDLLPAALQDTLIGQPAGGVTRADQVPAADLVERHSSSLVKRLKRRNFAGRLPNDVVVEPHRGRFYPQGMLEGVPGIYPENMSPMRVTELDEEAMTVDLNHPMAAWVLDLTAEVMEVHPAPEEHGGRCNEVMASLLNGPGIQVRDGKRPTDFFVNGAFRRPDGGSDTLFYTIPRMVQHLDARCLIEVEKLHRRLLDGRKQVLDLMGSWDSHLPAELAFEQVTGLGMNQEELDNNPRLDRRLVHNLNDDPKLPFDDGAFDAVICTVSVEYLTDPIAVFREVNRVLSPGGLFLVTFSNRWFPTKAIALWCDLHEFERMGLVSECFLQAGGFGSLNTLSMRGLPRPEDDPYYGRSFSADPLYAVWAEKVG